MKDVLEGIMYELYINAQENTLYECMQLKKEGLVVVFDSSCGEWGQIAYSNTYIFKNWIVIHNIPHAILLGIIS